MAPKLYMTIGSPPVRAVLLTEAALGIKLEHQEVSTVAQDNLKPEYLKLNPQHTVPLLIDDDGTKVIDSHAINAYLVGKYGKDDKLYPKDHALRADIDHKLHFDSGCIFALLRSIIYDLKVNKTYKVGETSKKLADENYDFLNKFLEGKQWVSGDSLTIADFSLLSSITSLNVLVPIDSKFTNIHKWIKKGEALPYYNVNQKGLSLFEGFVKFLTTKP